ncbi:MAG: hypothetical protein ABSC94_15960 [Polyangiaceae bacterium]|jgi:hypothetical protein
MHFDQALFVILLGSCTGAARRETSALFEAVDHYRRAAEPSKASQGQALIGLVCTDAAVCEAKRVCSEAVEPTTRALQLKSEVTARMLDLEQKRLAPGAPEAEALPAKLDEAAHLLEVGRAKMTECERRLADLRVRYGE